jgi:hypothetical protein
MKHCLTTNRALKCAALLMTAFPATMSAQSTFSQVVEADTYVSSGQPTMNFGSLGAMEIAAPTAAQARTEETLLRFNTAAMESAFNTDYGAGNWVVSSVTLSLLSNVSSAGNQPGNSSFNKIAAGQFEFDWLSNNGWSETGITWNSLPGILPGTGNNTSASLGDFNWAADGSSGQTWNLGLDPNLVGDIGNGGEVTILGQPTAGSTVGYLFNTLLNGPAQLNVTANAVPEPSAAAMMISVFTGFGIVRRLKSRK